MERRQRGAAATNLQLKQQHKVLAAAPAATTNTQTQRRATDSNHCSLRTTAQHNHALLLQAISGTTSALTNSAAGLCLKARQALGECV
jgi:hypothetical protein